MGLLRRVWLQQYYAPEAPPYGGVRLRATADLPPSGIAINSPYDPEAHYSTKRSTEWVGYKVHLTETCDEQRPQLITQVETTGATVCDVQLTAEVQQGLAHKGLLPSEHLVDTGYVDAQLLITTREEHAVELLGPVLPDHSWQAKEGNGYDVASFEIDWDIQVAMCPQGKQSRYWVLSRDRPGVKVLFDQADCLACECRSLCTHSQGGPRGLTLHPKEQHEALLAARKRQRTEEFRERYAQRAGIEGTISQGVRALGLRRSRYVGLAKTRLQHIATAAAINLQRLDDWWTGNERAQTRHSPFAQLAAVG